MAAAGLDSFIYDQQYKLDTDRRQFEAGGGMYNGGGGGYGHRLPVNGYQDNYRNDQDSQYRERQTWDPPETSATQHFSAESHSARDRPATVTSRTSQATDAVNEQVADASRNIKAEMTQIQSGRSESSGKETDITPNQSGRREKNVALHLSGSGLLPQEDDEGENKRIKLREQRRKEYNEWVEQKKENKAPLPPRPSSDGRNSRGWSQPQAPPQAQGEGLVAMLGHHEKKAQQLREERKKEYNMHIAEKNRAEEAKLAERATSNTGPAYNTQASNPITGTGGSNPMGGKANVQSETRPPEPRTGWSTPSYEEILEKKRKEEQNYRRYNDAEVYERLPPSGETYGNIVYSRRPSVSDGQLNRQFEENDLRIRQMEREYDNRRVRFTDDRSRRNSAGDDLFSDWLAPGSGSRQAPPAPLMIERAPTLEDEYSTRMHEPPGTRSQMLMAPATSNAEPRYSNVQQQHQAGKNNNRNNNNSERNNDQDGSVLPIGNNVRDSARRRKQDAYRIELQNQMAEKKAHKEREKQDSQKPAGNYMDGSFAPPAPSQAPQQRQQAPLSRVQPQRAVSPPEEYLVAGNGVPMGYGGGPMMGPGVYGATPQSPLLYQQALAGYMDNGYGYNTLQDPYNAGILQRPLFPPGAFQPQYQPPPMFALPAPSIQQQYSPPPMTHVQPMSMQQTGSVGGVPQQAQPIVGVPGMGRDSGKPEEDKKKIYQLELQKQMLEAQMKKQKEKEEKEENDRKQKQAEEEYSPFGRGGGGAPLRDKFGNVISSRNKEVVTNALQNGIQQNQPQASAGQTLDPIDPFNYSSTLSRDQEQLPSLINPLLEGNSVHARGGHQIFGPGLTEEQKHDKLKYQDELRLQMEDNKRRTEALKAKEKAEEEKIMKKIEEDNEKLRLEEEEVKRKAREKAEEEERKQAQIRKEMEDNMKEVERKKREAAEARAAELRKEREREVQREGQMDEQTHVPTRITHSPAVPALAGKIKSGDRQDRQDRQRDNASPPIRRPPTSDTARKQSADVLKQLAKMKKQLASEKNRVERDLKKEQMENIGRANSRLPPPSRGRVLRSAMRGGVLPEEEEVDIPDYRPNTGQELRPRVRRGSRDTLQRMFPGVGTEREQRDVIDRQDRELQRLRHKPTYDILPIEEADDDFIDSHSASPQVLNSVTAFIGHGVQDLPDDLEDLERARTYSASRSRRRDQLIKTPSTGSMSSLNPDEIKERNEERLRRLRHLSAGGASSAGDNLSLAYDDDEDALDRFVKKQQHRRPSSNSTLMDDSWIRPGSRR